MIGSEMSFDQAETPTCDVQEIGLLAADCSCSPQTVFIAALVAAVETLMVTCCLIKCWSMQQREQRPVVSTA